MRFSACRVAVAGILAGAPSCSGIIRHCSIVDVVSASGVRPLSQHNCRHYSHCTLPLCQSWKRNNLRPWMCPDAKCRAINRSGYTTCEACGTDKPRLLGWKCVACQTRNLSGVKVCKQCRAPAEKSKEYWMCAVCGENNRVDEIEDNSRCGFCSYDMAPPTVAEEEVLRRAQTEADMQQSQQEAFDSISLKDAEKQLGDPLAGGEELKPFIRQPQANRIGSPLPTAKLVVPEVKPFVPTQRVVSRHSRLRRRTVEADMAAAATPSGPPGFDWMCRGQTCGHINPGDEENCTLCGDHIAPSEWECQQCGAMNHLSRSRCFNCRSAIAVSWACSACSTATSIYDKVCRQCGLERPPVEPKEAREVRRNQALFGMQQHRQRSDWHCPSCNAVNFSRRTECYQCSAARPTVTEEDGLSGAGFNSGGAPSSQHNNWICTNCQASNFRTRTKCWKCSKESERENEWSSEPSAMPHFAAEGFQEGADTKSSGNQAYMWKKTDEWTCAKCFSKNGKNRSECHRCGSRKTAIVASRRASTRKPVKL